MRTLLITDERGAGNGRLSERRNMPRKKLIQLPEGINPGGLLTVKAASKLTGIPESTIRGYSRQPGIGLRFYKISGRLYLKCDELLRWINTVAVQVPMSRPLDSKFGRGRD